MLSDSQIEVIMKECEEQGMDLDQSVEILGVLARMHNYGKVKIINSQQQEAAIAAMTQADKYKAFRNYMVNELGVGKDDIRSWVIESIQEEAKKLLGQLNVTSLAERAVRDAIDSLARSLNLQDKLQTAFNRLVQQQIKVVVNEPVQPKAPKE